jgi:hypothetical protein
MCPLYEANKSSIGNFLESISFLLLICLVCSVCGRLMGAWIGAALSAPPVTPDDGPALIAGGANMMCGGLFGLLLGPVSMIVVRTKEPLRFERTVIGLLVPVVIPMLIVAHFHGR